jgi:spore coat polysaccharide biosynthesis protein SpsF (cytidylyltransferase family)
MPITNGLQSHRVETLKERLIRLEIESAKTKASRMQDAKIAAMTSPEYLAVVEKLEAAAKEGCYELVVDFREMDHNLFIGIMELFYDENIKCSNPRSHPRLVTFNWL